MRKEITKTIPKIIDVCDICKNTEAQGVCDVCNRMLCESCRTYDNFGDYTEYEGSFCQQCWGIGTPYRKQENEAQEVCDTAFEDIWVAWKKEATKDLTD